MAGIKSLPAFWSCHWHFFTCPAVFQSLLGVKLDGFAWAVNSTFGWRDIRCGGTDDARFALNLLSFTVIACIKPESVKGRCRIVTKRFGNVGSPFVICVRDGQLTFDAMDDAVQ